MLTDTEKTVAFLREVMTTASPAVFFGGAGVSTESGIPDFRGTPQEASASFESILSDTCLRREPERFYRYFRRHMLFPQARPNRAHEALAKLEAEGFLRGVITQNVDGLHQRAGSRRVLELHGSTAVCYCNRCGKLYPPESLMGEAIPRCEKESCRGLVRPDVVLYGESLKQTVWAEACQWVAEADLLLVGGTSLLVQPAASLLEYFRGRYLVMINRQPTPYDGMATVVCRDSVGEVLAGLTSRE